MLICCFFLYDFLWFFLICSWSANESKSTCTIFVTSGKVKKEKKNSWRISKYTIKKCILFSTSSTWWYVWHAYMYVYIYMCICIFHERKKSFWLYVIQKNSCIHEHFITYIGVWNSECIHWSIVFLWIHV